MEFTSTRLGSTLTGLSLDSLGKRYCTQRQVTVLIQGAPHFTSHFREWSEKKLRQARTLELIPTDEVKDWDDTFLWKGDLSHQSLGGVISGSWSYRCSEPLEEPRRGVNQNLGLLLEPTHGGKALSKVLDEMLTDPNLLQGQNLIKPCETTPWVISPSVFTKENEMILRRLQVDELLDVYDVEVSTQKELGKYWCLAHCSPSYAFAQVAPLKVGIKLICLFYSKLRNDGWSHDPPSMNDLADSRKRLGGEYSVESVTNPLEVDQPVSSNGSKPKRAKPAFSSSREWKPEDIITSPPDPVVSSDLSDTNHGPSVKATKNDDTKVNERQWDTWSVDHFRPPKNTEAKVCRPGTYYQVAHGNLFHGLRKLAVTWY